MIAHVFVDAENISPAVTFKVVEHFGKEHTITKVDIIGKEEVISHRYRDLDKNLYRVQNCFYGKNSADTWLCIEIVRAIIDEPELELIIIVSCDKDFLPVIKFAADFEKKIFVVSDGTGHRRLIELLKTLEVHPTAVELKDFQTGFKIIPPKLKKFFLRMSMPLRRFYVKHMNAIKYVLIRRSDGKISEAPFVEGMNVNFFGKVLRELKFLGKNNPLQQFLAKNFLKVAHDNVYFFTEEELSEPEVTQPSDVVTNFLQEHESELCTVFIKHNEKISEAPFVNGMPLNIFGQLLRDRKIIGKNASPANVAINSLLDVHDGKVFLHDEDDLDEAYDRTIKDVGEYFDYHAQETTIFIKHAQKIFEIPFTNGMPIEIFGKLLREKNIIGKSASAINVAKKSLLDVRDGKVFLCDEDKLSELYAESTGNLEDYFAQSLEAKNIFIKHNGKFFEIPFVDGMPLGLFEKLLRDRKIIGRNSSAIKIAVNSLLEIRGERVFLIGEDELEAAQDDLENSVDNYLNEHALEIQTASIQHDGQVYSIPFVSGMPIKIFGKLLRERKIIDRKILPEEIAVANSFIIRDEKIFSS